MCIRDSCKGSRFRFITGVQESLFDNPGFQFVADEGRDRMDSPGMGIAQGDGLHRTTGQNRGLEQPGIEAPNRLAGGGSPFREHQHPLALAQAPDQLLRRLARFVVAAAPNEGCLLYTSRCV